MVRPYILQIHRALHKHLHINAVSPRVIGKARKLISESGGYFIFFCYFCGVNHLHLYQNISHGY